MKITLVLHGENGMRSFLEKVWPGDYRGSFDQSITNQALRNRTLGSFKRDVVPSLLAAQPAWEGYRVEYISAVYRDINKVFNTWESILKSKELAGGSLKSAAGGSGVFGVNLVFYSFDSFRELDVAEVDHLDAAQLAQLLARVAQIEVTSTYGCVVDWTPKNPSDLLDRDQALVIFPDISRI
ncbi:hypothetical protein [Deinococcus multiflagellatus]|uniref:hypothetical protein n=1 Tax=Deinococcus multiflagellatus TaxID=1656887 RepID=UPI001CCD08D0|nr:hypothetical protein [Deinococcus multiflagellatus]MBZ9716039.1 hypothetical protein [Deinococcus multiflagellatus]